MTAPGFQERSTELATLLRTRPLIRVVNYHNTPQSQAAHFEQELSGYSHSFSSVNQDELISYLRTGQWHKPMPGLLPVAYEGYRNGFDVLAPMLERYGFVGWFFIITDFVNTPVAHQAEYARSHRIGMKTKEYADSRFALSWEEIRQLDKKHVIASHARSHSELSTLDDAMLEHEVKGSQEEFKQHLGHPVEAFASLRGPAHGDFPRTDRIVEAAGYRVVFSNFRVQLIPSVHAHAG